MESVSIGDDYELRYGDGLLDIWFRGDRRVYRCDPRMVRYKFTRARVFGGQYLEFWGETQEGGFTHRIKAEYVDAAKAFVTQVFEGGATARTTGSVELRVYPDAAGGDGSATAGDGAALTPRAEGDRIEQLTRLAGLRDRGVLTDAEFAAEKARILGDV